MKCSEFNIVRCSACNRPIRNHSRTESIFCLRKITEVRT